MHKLSIKQYSRHQITTRSSILHKPSFNISIRVEPPLRLDNLELTKHDSCVDSRESTKALNTRHKTCTVCTWTQNLIADTRRIPTRVSLLKHRNVSSIVRGSTNTEGVEHLTNSSGHYWIREDARHGSSFRRITIPSLESSFLRSSTTHKHVVVTPASQMPITTLD